MDIRIEKTRQSIINAFIELRSHKELERITIKELCEKAQINKSTFLCTLSGYLSSLGYIGNGSCGINYGESHSSGESAGGYCFFFQGTVHGVSGKGFADWDFVFRKQE